jgi:hypothetical protein
MILHGCLVNSIFMGRGAPREHESSVAKLPFSHSTELRGGGWHHSAKAAGGEDLDIEEPVACRYASAFHFHPTLPGMLGSMLIWDEIIRNSTKITLCP